MLQATHLFIVCLRQYSEHITIKRSAVLIKGRFAPTSRMEAPLRAEWIECKFREGMRSGKTDPSGIGAFKPGIRSVG